MLHHEKCSSRPKNTADLPERDIGVGDGAENESGNTTVEAMIGKGKRGSGASDNGPSPSHSLGYPPLNHGPGDLQKDRSGFREREKGEVGSRSGAKVKDVAFKPLQECLSKGCNPLIFYRPEEGIVDGGKDPFPKRGGRIIDVLHRGSSEAFVVGA
jgi:hypothetical protein